VKDLMAASYRPDIDGLRALSIAAVVAYHAAPDVLRGGFVGVDVFFVISGFLITGIIQRELRAEHFSLTRFYGRRIRRILPALTLVLATCLAFGWVSLFPVEYRQLGKHTGAAAAFVSNVVLWAESGYFDAASQTKPLLHLWSLAVEEQYYLVWPVLLILAAKLRLKALGLALAVLAVSLASCIVLTPTDPTSAFYLPGTRFWEIMAGSVLALISLERRKAADKPVVGRSAVADLAGVLGVLGVLGILLSAALMTSGGGFPGWQATLPVGSAALVIAAGPNGIVNRSLLSHPWLVALGLISFPLYLWHWPLLSFATIVESDVPDWTIRLAAVLAALLLATATYLLVERPIRSLRPGLGLGVTLLGLLGCVGAAGAAVYVLDGVHDRAAIRAYAVNDRQLMRLPERDQACIAHIGGGSPAFPYCRFRPAGPQTVAVIGDSHAHTAYPGIADALAGRGVSTILLANSGCPPFLGGEYGANPRERDACRVRIEAITGLLQRDPSISDVIIFSRGTLYLTGLGFGAAERGRDGPPMIEPQRFAASLQATIDALRSSGKRVVYVLENPETGQDPRRCVDRPFRRARSCGIAEDVVLQRQADYRRLVGTLRGATIVDSLPAFCSGGTCGLTEPDGTLLYADDNHLSVAGSARQAAIVMTDVLAAVGTPGPSGGQ
jgi:peptidoglycan/LPS O-acetylase OafA/YrhL